MLIMLRLAMRARPQGSTAVLRYGTGTLSQRSDSDYGQAARPGRHTRGCQWSGRSGARDAGPRHWQVLVASWHVAPARTYFTGLLLAPGQTAAKGDGPNETGMERYLSIPLYGSSLNFTPSRSESRDKEIRPRSAWHRCPLTQAASLTT